MATACLRLIGCVCRLVLTDNESQSHIKVTLGISESLLQILGRVGGEHALQVVQLMLEALPRRRESIE